MGPFALVRSWGKSLGGSGGGFGVRAFVSTIRVRVKILVKERVMPRIAELTKKFAGALVFPMTSQAVETQAPLFHQFFSLPDGKTDKIWAPVHFVRVVFVVMTGDPCLRLTPWIGIRRQTYLGGVGFLWDSTESGDVFSCLTQIYGGNHPKMILQKSS